MGTKEDEQGTVVAPKRGAKRKSKSSDDSGSQPDAGTDIGGNDTRSGGELAEQSGTSGVVVEVKEKNKKQSIGDSIYEPYEPAKVKIKGAKKHPASIVESAASDTVFSLWTVFGITG